MYPSRSPARNALAIATVLWGVMASLGARAGTAPAASRRPPPATRKAARLSERLLVVTVNGLHGTTPVLIVLRDGRAYAPKAAFAAWRIPPPAVAGITYNGGAYLPLDAVPGLHSHIDEATQTLILQADPRLFPATTFGARTGALSAPPPAPPGGFFNYDVQYAHQAGDGVLNGLLEVGAFNRWGVVTSSFAGATGGSDDRFVRLDTRFTRDFPERMASLRVGDSISHPGAWGRAVRFAGVQWTTDFATQPQFIRYPMPTFHGEAALPSTVEIYTNNVKRLSEQVPPGPFSIRNVPAVTGSGDVRLVVRDVLGREHVITQPYYVSRNLLRKGLSTFAYELGALREDFGFKSNAYGPAFAAATWRHGLSRRLTAGVHAEAMADRQALGVSGAWLWPAVGTFNLSVAGSRHAGKSGGLVSLGVQRLGRRFSFGLDTAFTTRNFTQVGMLDGMAVPRQSTLAHLGVSLGHFGQLSFGYSHMDYRDLPDSEYATLGYSANLGGGFYLSLFGLKDLAGEGSDSIGLVVTKPLGARTTLSASVHAQGGEQRAGLQVQRSLPAGNGVGYLLDLEAGDNARDRAALLTRNRIGTYRLDVARFGGETAYRLGMRGGMVMLGGHAFLTRQVDDSFGVVKVGHYAGVTVYRENHPIATTDKSGYALIPRLLAYQNNNLRIEQSDLPLTAHVDTLKLHAVPWYRSGVLVDFGVHANQAALVSIVLDDGKPLPPGARAELIATGKQFPVGLRGEAYVTGLSQHNQMRVTWIHQTCTIDFDFTAGDNPLPTLGPFTCHGVARKPEGK